MIVLNLVFAKKLFPDLAEYVYPFITQSSLSLKIYIATGSAMFAVAVLMSMVILIVRNFRRKMSRQPESQFESHGSQRPLLQTSTQSYNPSRPHTRDSMPLRSMQIIENPHYNQRAIKLKTETGMYFKI